MAHPISLKFHGVRAIHSVPTIKNQTTGGNTSCIEVIDGVSRIFINAGFGLSHTGDNILEQFKRGLSEPEINILFSDFLWDSMMGLTSFAPLYHPDTRLNILTGTSSRDAQAALDDVTSNLFSPFYGFANMAAKTSIIEVKAPIQIGDWVITSMALANKLTENGCSIWRLKHQTSGEDLGIVMLSDTTPESIGKLNSFLGGCQTIICGATKPSSHPNDNTCRMGFLDALHLAMAANAQSLILTHFHPAQSDIELQAEYIYIQRQLNAIYGKHQKHAPTIRLATELTEQSLGNSQTFKIAV